MKNSLTGLEKVPPRTKTAPQFSLRWQSETLPQNPILEGIKEALPRFRVAKFSKKYDRPPPSSATVLGMKCLFLRRRGKVAPAYRLRGAGLAVTAPVALAAFLGCSAPDGMSGDRGDDGNLPLPDNVPPSALLPARIRRLTNAEYNSTVAALLGTTLSPADDFPPDARQHGYTLNEAQRVDPVLARQLDAAAIALAAEAKLKLTELAPCADPVAQGESCASEFISKFGEKAYRRPLDESDLAGLLGLYRAGATSATYADGIEQVIRGILQSPGFLYHTEIGNGSLTETVSLTSYEMASSLSYLLTGGPPDEELLAQAESGGLDTPEGRAEQVRRIFLSPGGKERSLRLVREWLGIDRIATTAKDSNVYPDYAGLKDAIELETEGFVYEVLGSSSGSVADFLGATYTVADAALLSFYGASGTGKAETGRVGLLNQAAFLSVYAHAHETAPVLRGTAVMRRVGCVDIELPTSLDVVIVPPLPDPEKTTRERFSIHSTDAVCSSCHNLIDPLGFSFEQFDGMGAARSTENGKPIDSAAAVSIGLDFDGSYPNSYELSRVIAGSADVRECFARQIFRGSVGEAMGIEAPEDSFVTLWAELPAEGQGTLLEILTRFAESSLFSHRRPQ